MISSSSGDSSMTKTITSASIAVVVLAFASLGWAESLKVEPGMWKTVVTTTSADGRVQGPFSSTRCVAQKDIGGFGDKLAETHSAQQETCSRTSYKETANTVEFSYQCTGRLTVDGGGSFKFDNPSHFSGDVTTTGTVMGKAFSNDAKMEGNRTGSCTGN
jgi:hypothetical protein